MLKQFNDPSDEEDDENGDEQSSIASDDSQLDNHIADANDMSMGMDVVQEELEGAGMLPGDGNMSTQQVSQPSQDEDVDADEEPTQAQDGAAEEEADEEVQVTHNKRNRLSGTTESATAGGTAIHYGKVRATVTSGASMEEGEEDNLLDEPTEKQQQQQQQGEEEEEEATERNIEGADGDTGDDDASLANRTMATAKSHRSSKTTKTTKAKKSTGNALYRMALEEEERRSRRHKGNSLLDDEAAEEEEEGLQAGLGDFGFGVTSNIREHDEEMVRCLFFVNFCLVVANNDAN